ncbi:MULTISPECIES: NYN domain-containing protein [unclassified Lentimonas]|uniref:NYN domain-containing protein n=1 Tax=unclassified Lentimonas TaxID=2630993 RepID=UPI0013272DEC|nr:MULTISPECIES: NYN domain-containing protein [unclassified Lentimonas]CAA6694951.1 Unannotated [Lentimonas sp. CC19]CAA6695273.1 Unannotated [Lentimonas sp. CC10]CAA7071984.1 Unannotated [Lentimonas sp. CC11]
MCSTTKDTICLLIDADNSPAAKINFIIEELASYGVVNIRRAYGNWTKRALHGWEKVLHDHAIQPIQLFDMVKGKNGTDIALVIDAMDILYTKEVQTFAIASSDCDFTPLIMRLRAEGKKVIGFGGQNTPAPFINGCTKFLYLDEDAAAKARRKSYKVSAAELKENTKLMQTLITAVETLADHDGWADLAPVGSHISNQGPFDHRTYGFARLRDLFGALDTFEVKTAQQNNQISYRVRLKT